nr:NAD(P)/FAD-dependent oxidoreductase [uncultured Flavobacterium sp.]
MKKRVIIIGGGFAGVNLANSLSNSKNFEIILVDKNNYNFFPPLLYQVATGFLETSSIAYPFRKLFKGKQNITFWLGELVEVLQEENKVILSNGELDYDFLVFAAGTITNYFGMENLKKNAIPMKTMDDALNMRNILLQRIEKASKSINLNEKSELLTIVIVGGGPTGVELAGMFAEMSKSIIEKEYPEFFNFWDTKIYLIENGDEILKPMSVKSKKHALETLTTMGVDVKLNTGVTDFDGSIVKLTDGNIIKTKNLIWAAGVTGIKFCGINDSQYGRGNRLIVDAYNKVVDTENIFAIGDGCIQENIDKNYPSGHPQVAQVAIQQGKNLGENFHAIAKNKKLQHFKYKDKGSMAIIGKSNAVVDIMKKYHLNGFIALLMWLFIHLNFLVNRNNRFKTFINWIIAYITNNQSLRMIVRPSQN